VANSGEIPRCARNDNPKGKCSSFAE